MFNTVFIKIYKQNYKGNKKYERKKYSKNVER